MSNTTVWSQSKLYNQTLPYFQSLDLVKIFDY